MKEIIEIFKRELRNVSKDSSLFLILLLAPILYAFMYGSIYLNKGEEKVKLALIDDDGTAISRTLTQQFNSTSMIEIVPASNIAEGHKRETKNDTAYFYVIAQSSLEELRYQLILSRDLKYISEKEYFDTEKLAETVAKILYAWKKNQK